MAQSTFHFLAQWQGQIDHTSLERQDTSCVPFRVPDADAALLESNMKSNGTVMKSNSTLAVVQSIYDNVNLALWATLAAFVVVFLAFVAPRLPEAAARAEALRIQEIARENDGYCAKWQMGLGTKMHDQCLLDLQELREKIRDRIAAQLDF
jgi:hypothetical protein